MECKLKNSIGFPVAADELIDTLWNVNLADNIWVRKLKCELIDTLWNVNLVTMYYEDGKFVELIDTLWNVNVFLHR